MRRLYKGFIAGALVAAMLFTPVDAASAKTLATAQTEDGEHATSGYSVSFDANKGKKVKTTLTVTGGEAYGKLPKTTRTGYKFLGWYTKKTGGRKVTAKSVFDLRFIRFCIFKIKDKIVKHSIITPGIL